MRIAVFWFFAFALGSLPTAYWFAKRLKGVDIRTQGSGNVGATNAFRVLGKGPGLLVFALDFMKGWLPVFLFLNAQKGPSGTGAETAALGVGIAAMLGHIFTPFLGFKGGKGVATGAGVLLAFSPGLWALSLAIWGLIFWLTRTVSLASLGAIVSLAPLSFFFKKEYSTVSVFGILFLLVLWTHRENLKRLYLGVERKL